MAFGVLFLSFCVHGNQFYQRISTTTALSGAECAGKLLSLWWGLRPSSLLSKIDLRVLCCISAE